MSAAVATPPPLRVTAEGARRSTDFWLLGAVGLGIAVRLYHVVRSDFPLNDGGLFLIMIEALRANHYVLPESIPWAQYELPFAYPPLAFYAAGLLGDVTGIDTIQLLRILPFVGSAAIVIAFALFARALLNDRTSHVSAVFAFALMPQGFGWSIAGGGLTRAPGQLFALLALHQLLLVFQGRGRWHLVAASACAGLTVLSHPESAVLLAASALLLTCFYGRSRDGIASVVLVGIGTLIVVLPWCFVALSRYGLAPFLAAGGNSGGPAAVVAVLASPLAGLPGGPLIGPLWMLGVAVVWFSDRRFFLPAWLLTTAFLARSFFVYSAPPIALLAGVGAARVLFPGLAAASMTTDRATTESSVATPEPRFVALMLLLYSAAVSLQLSVPTLALEERQAMAWISANTSTEASFLVLTTWTGGEGDPTGDWFTALTGRRGLSPPQGTEWIAKSHEPVAAYARLQACGTRDAACLEQWATDQKVEYDHVYVPAPSRAANSDEPLCCRELLRSLSAEPRYRLVYDGTGASVFERVSAAQ